MPLTQNFKYRSFLFVLIGTSSFLGCKEQGQIKIDLSSAPAQVELFGDKKISTGLYERDIAITPDGNEIIYTLSDYKQHRRCLVNVKNKTGHWGNPEILNISGEYHDIEPFYADNGNSLYFASNRPLTKDSTVSDYNIWHSIRNNTGWDPPQPLSQKINTDGDEFYPSLSKNGNLYFTATRKDGIGREDIFVSRMVDGIYQEPEVLDTSINSAFYEFNAYINPQEDLLIFSSYGRADDKGGGDLYFSTKDKNGHWKKARNMGSDVNSDKLDYCPFIDENRNMFYFTSERVKEVPAKLINIGDLKAYSNSAKNGMGDIYRVGVDHLELD